LAGIHRATKTNIDENTMNDGIVYQDGLVEISRDTIVFKNYYFPLLTSKIVFIDNIEKVEVKEPSIFTGKYRYHGSGDLRTWFPMDMNRHKRDKIFFLFLKNTWVRIGFTAENSGAVETFFKEKGLLSQ
jgi:hypothetical protein